MCHSSTESANSSTDFRSPNKKKLRYFSYMLIRTEGFCNLVMSGMRSGHLYYLQGQLMHKDNFHNQGF